MPHVGTHVPPALAARFALEGQSVPDTDWHLERLYDFADPLYDAKISSQLCQKRLNAWWVNRAVLKRLLGCISPNHQTKHTDRCRQPIRQFIQGMRWCM